MKTDKTSGIVTAQPEQESAEVTSPSGCSRRDFLRWSALFGGSAAFLGGSPIAARAIEEVLGGKAPFFETLPENQIYTVCLQCNTGCGIKVKLQDGVAAKIDGNPYSPWTLWPHPAFKTPVKELANVEGAICPKGQAGLQTAYDPYRIMTVLKRKPGTKRGGGEWVTIPFEKAVEEVVNGGDLFGEGPVEGFKSVYAVKDAKLAKAMNEEIGKILDEKDKARKKELVEAFKVTFKDQLGVLIDPEHPDLGPKNNQFAFVWGRMKNGREDLAKRFVRDGFGSTNANGHTTVCQGSLYFTGKAMSEQFDPAKGKFGGGDKFYWQGDTGNAEFIIFVGANLFEANYGPPQRVPRITERVSRGELKYAVLDPRCSKVASKAWKWVPVQPGTDAAFAAGMIRWIVDNQKLNVAFLANANRAAAVAANEASWTNASWLVKVKDGKPGAFVRGSELGLVDKKVKKDKDGKEEATFVAKKGGAKWPFDPLVALVEGKPVLLDPNDEKAPAVKGDLLAATSINGLDLKTGLQVIAEAAQTRSVADWAKLAGVAERDILELAKEFTSHGTKAVADIHRGPSQHTNGFYNNLSWYTLNCLIGNPDHKGGMIKLSTYDRMGGKPGQPFPLGKLVNGKAAPFGIDLIRTNTAYEKSTIFAGYPSKRPWFPLATDVYQEDAPSIGDAYPYPVKILFTYMSAMAWSLPAGQPIIDVLSDPKKLPLHITSDIMIGDSSQFADYIFPDVSFLERWEFHGSHPSVPWKVENVRQPAIAIPGWPTTKVFGEEIPLSFEAVVLAVAEKLALPGFGPNGFGEGKPYTRPEHLYLKQVANIAFGEKADGSDAVPDADAEELRIFLEARKHLPKSVFDADKWRAAVGDAAWKKAVYVLNRGGRYQDYAKAYPGELVGNKYGKLLGIYQEKTATSINTMTGKPYAGYGTYLPPALSSIGEPITDPGYDLHLITYKEITMAKARTIADYWLTAVTPEGFLVMSKTDADRLGLRDGERVRVSSASNPDGVWDVKAGAPIPIVGKLKVVQGIRPGVVAFPLGFGHWASGARDVTIDGQRVKGDPRRAAPFHANGAMRVDPHLKNVTLSDLAGGSAVFYDTKVKVVRA
jgi:anaerobic selenocysteine-containing dehydrogenase